MIDITQIQSALSFTELDPLVPSEYANYYNDIKMLYGNDFDSVKSDLISTIEAANQSQFEDYAYSKQEIDQTISNLNNAIEQIEGTISNLGTSLNELRTDVQTLNNNISSVVENEIQSGLSTQIEDAVETGFENFSAVEFLPNKNIVQQNVTTQGVDLEIDGQVNFTLEAGKYLLTLNGYWEITSGRVVTIKSDLIQSTAISSAYSYVDGQAGSKENKLEHSVFIELEETKTFKYMLTRISGDLEGGSVFIKSNSFLQILKLN